MKDLSEKTHLPLRAVWLVAALGLMCLLLAFSAPFLGDPFLHIFLLWNIFLAGVPMLCAAVLTYRQAKGSKGVASFVWAALWLAFFPNAPYMLTDLIHLERYDFQGVTSRYSPALRAWFGMAYVVAAVAVGCLFGFLSLYLMHRQVRERWGRTAGQLFCVGTSALTGVGIYIGRVLRFNSWDLLRRPLALLQALAAQLSWHMVALCGLFCALTLFAYGLFYLCFHAHSAGALPDAT